MISFIPESHKPWSSGTPLGAEDISKWDCPLTWHLAVGRCHRRCGLQEWGHEEDMVDRWASRMTQPNGYGTLRGPRGGARDSNITVECKLVRSHLNPKIFLSRLQSSSISCALRSCVQFPIHLPSCCLGGFIVSVFLENLDFVCSWWGTEWVGEDRSFVQVCGLRSRARCVSLCFLWCWFAVGLCSVRLCMWGG